MNITFRDSLAYTAAKHVLTSTSVYI